MASVTYRDHQGAERVVEAQAGDSVMETAMRHGVDGIVAECGGSLSCATCHVFVESVEAGAVPEMTEMEDEMLWGTSVDREDNSRLSCQLVLEDDTDIRVTTPETQV